MATIVLVGGSFLGGWAWERVTPVLREAGHRVHPLTLTGFGDRAHLAGPDTSLSVHVTDIVSMIESAELTDVVLVAHSYAGAPASIAAARVPERIARLVYIAAELPVPGRTLFENAPAGVEDMMVQMADAYGDGWRVPVMPDAVLDTFGEHGLSDDDRAWFHRQGVGQPIGTYRERVPDDLSALDRLPRTYVVCEGDAAPPPVTAGSPGFDVLTLPAGHWPMITEPQRLAELLDKVVRD